MKYKDIITLDSDYNLLGIFSKINNKYPNKLIFLNNEKVTLIDNSYFLHSGEKELSYNYNQLKKLLGDFPSVDEVVIDKLIDSIIIKFSDNWNKIYQAYFETEYKPLENYSMIEKEIPDLNETITSNNTSSNNTKTNTKMDSSSSNNGNGNYYGFNSSYSVPQSQQNSTSTSQVQGNADDNFSNTSINENKTSSVKKTGTRELTRSGNIGVTTSQQMLESELKLREYDFYKIIFNDVDSILCHQLYQF